jgi:hypothetical protein
MQIAKLLARLTVLAPVAGKTVDAVRTLLETAHDDAGMAKQMNALKQALELQAKVNEEVAEQLRLFKSVLEGIQRSFKLWALATVATAILALAAIVIALLK